MMMMMMMMCDTDEVMMWQTQTGRLLTQASPRSDSLDDCDDDNDDGDDDDGDDDDDPGLSTLTELQTHLAISRRSE